MLSLQATITPFASPTFAERMAAWESCLPSSAPQQPPGSSSGAATLPGLPTQRLHGLQFNLDLFYTRRKRASGVNNMSKVILAKSSAGSRKPGPAHSSDTTVFPTPLLPLREGGPPDPLGRRNVRFSPRRWVALSTTHQTGTLLLTRHPNALCEGLKNKSRHWLGIKNSQFNTYICAHTRPQALTKKEES